MEQKYQLKEDNYLWYKGRKLYQIEALHSIQNPYRAINMGERGGFVESKNCLSQLGTCWVNECALVLNDGYVSGDAYVGGMCIIDGASVNDHSVLDDRVILRKGVKVRGNAKLIGTFEIDHEMTIMDGDLISRNTKYGGLYAI